MLSGGNHHPSRLKKCRWSRAREEVVSLSSTASTDVIISYSNGLYYFWRSIISQQIRGPVVLISVHEQDLIVDRMQTILVGTRYHIGKHARYRLGARDRTQALKSQDVRTVPAVPEHAASSRRRAEPMSNTNSFTVTSRGASADKTLILPLCHHRTPISFCEDSFQTVRLLDGHRGELPECMTLSYSRVLQIQRLMTVICSPLNWFIYEVPVFLVVQYWSSFVY